MKYRAVYKNAEHGAPAPFELIYLAPNESNVITETGQKFLVDELDTLIWQLSGMGVDVSKAWRERAIDRFDNDDLVDISSLVEEGVSRKACPLSVSIDYPSRRFRYNIIVKHYISGAYDNVFKDDVFVSRIVDNSADIEGVPEFDYFYNMLESKAIGMLELQRARIQVMDANGIFDNIY